MNHQTWSRDDERNIDFYNGLVERYGVDVRALNWGSRESQQLRFSVLAQVGQLNDKSLLDVGCGQGDFYGSLKEQEIKVDYTGIDLAPKMIEIARSRFPEARFETENLLAPQSTLAADYDYVLSSGIFYYRQHEPFAFMKEMLARMFERCRLGLAFNSLSAWCGERDAGEFYADPLETLAFCRTLTPWLTLRHDYHPRDFTIYMHKRNDTA